MRASRGRQEPPNSAGYIPLHNETAGIADGINITDEFAWAATKTIGFSLRNCWELGHWSTIIEYGDNFIK